MESKPSKVFKVTELAILITAFVSDPTHVMINAEFIVICGGTSHQQVHAACGNHAKTLPDVNFSF